MRTLHIFAGAGGGLLADLILGHQPACAVEWDAHCCNVLRERAAEGWFPGLHVHHGDVREFDFSPWADQRLAILAHEIAAENRTCYPNWADVEARSGLNRADFMKAFGRLCDAGVVFSGFPSLLPLLADAFPLVPMFGPIGGARPSAEVWMKIRKRIFERDDFTCHYCGARGVALECDHVVPVAQGGGHDDENLATACRDCNRSKGARTPEEWGLWNG